MQRHVNDWVGTLKATIPFLTVLQNHYGITLNKKEGEELGAVIREAEDIVKAAEDTLATLGNQAPTFESELKSLINRFSKEGGSDTPDFILCEFLINALNIFDIATNERRNWQCIKTVDQLRGCPKPDILKTKEERKAEALREINKTPYGANLGKNGPEIVPGLKFANVHMPGFTFHVLTVDNDKNQLFVQVNPPESHGVHPWTEDWNLQHTRWGFEKGEYWQATKEEVNQAKQAIDDYYKTRSHWEAEALKKRPFPAGGIFEGAAAFEARKQHNKAEIDKVLSNIDSKRKQAGREIMVDIENRTLETLQSHKKTVEYVPAPLWEEFNRTNAELARLWNNHQHQSQEYKDLQKRANELAADISKVKKEAIKKEAADNVAEMVAGATQIVDAYVAAAKALKVFTQEAKEADAVRAKIGHTGAIKDLNDINTNTPEGRLLMAALAKITTESQRDKTPWEVIGQLNELKVKMYDENGTGQAAWDASVAKAAVTLQEAGNSEGVKCIKCGDYYPKGRVCKNCFIDENAKCETR